MNHPDSTNGTDGRLRLTKHHGAGNDFLVLVYTEGGAALDPVLVRSACDRRFGVGADGVIRVTRGAGSADLGMELRNADGGVAEMSGNGMRCLAQAAVEAGLVPPTSFTVQTLAGVKSVEYHPGATAGAAEASVDMGPATLGPAQPGALPGHPACLVDMGNPHLVVVVPDVDEVDMDEVGPRLQRDHPDGINVECIAIGPGSDAITLRVWERGVGETLACGSGSAAAAAAAHQWGLVGARVAVHNPGGTLFVQLSPDGIRLEGPVRKVASLELDPAQLLAAARP